MSWSSTGSSTPGFRRAGGMGGAEARSPVRYRDGSRRHGWGGSEVAGAVPRVADGVRAGEVLPVRPPEEGAEMDFMEATKSRLEVLGMRWWVSVGMLFDWFILVQCCLSD